jgi:hypothetical protein
MTTAEPATIYVLVNRLEDDLRDDVEYASADSFIAAFWKLEDAMEAADAERSLATMEQRGDTFEVLQTTVWADGVSHHTQRRESIATLFSK